MKRQKPLQIKRKPSNHYSCWVFVSGGGEGSRTPVRKQFHEIFSGRRRLFQAALPPCSPSSRQAVTPASWVRVIIHGPVNSFRAHVHCEYDALAKPQSSQGGRLPLIRQREEQVRCSLIYKVAHY